jgi:hypothetical protein
MEAPMGDTSDSPNSDPESEHDHHSNDVSFRDYDEENSSSHASHDEDDDSLEPFDPEETTDFLKPPTKDDSQSLLPRKRRARDDDEEETEEEEEEEEKNLKYSATEEPATEEPAPAEEEQTTSLVNLPPALKDGHLEFTLNSALQSQFVCDLCLGYLREPYRITTCLHVFCKSCLLLSIDRAGHNCPTCNGYLGRLAKEEEITFQPDRLLHHLMDNVLFPHVAQADDQAEAEFYASLGIPPKSQYRKQLNENVEDYDAEEVEGADDDNDVDKEDNSSRMISFQLAPSVVHPSSCSQTMTNPLQRPFLETESALTIAVLKKYLQEHEKVTISEMYCLGTVLGNEWSIDFVDKTLWRKKFPQKRRLQLVLEYSVGGSTTTT